MSITISGTGAITGATTSYSFDQSVSVGGTITYEDVTNVDSVGIITARAGIEVTGGNIHVAGVGATIGVATAYINSINDLGYPSTGALSNRNLIINGAMQVSQRRTSSTGLTGSINDYYTVDRYRFENYNDASSNSSVWTMEQSSDAPVGFSSSLKCTATTADSDYGSGLSQTNIHTRLEGQDFQHLKYGTANAEKLTLSFWVKSSVTGTYLAWFYQLSDHRHCTKAYTINAADTWEYKTVTINGDTTGVIDNNSAQGLTVRWLLGTGSGFTGGTYLDGNWAAFTDADTYAGQTANVASTVNNSFAITGIQLEVGERATPFEHRSFGDELIRCQRYYEKSYDIDVAPGTANGDGTFHWQSNGAGGSIASFPARFTVRKRAAPTIVVYNPENGNSGSLRCDNGTNQSGGSYNPGQTGFNFRTTLAATTDNRYVGHYTASAEL